VAAVLLVMDELIHRQHPSSWAQFYSSPLLFLARHLYNASTYPLQPPSNDTICVVCISDTHNSHASLPPLPAGDILIHAGDLSQSGSPEEVSAALDWMAAQPHLHKFLIAATHDRCLEDVSCQSHLRSLLPRRGRPCLWTRISSSHTAPPLTTSTAETAAMP